MKNELELARSEIDRIDGEMADLFRRRMEVCARIADYKSRHSLPVRDPAREASVLAARCRDLGDGALAPYYEEFLQTIFDLSRRYQSSRIGAEEGRA